MPSLRGFEAYLAKNEHLLPELANIAGFKEEVWKSYFKVTIELYKDLVDKFQAAEKRKKEIEQEAARQRTQWESVIDIFNDRFFVPFKLNVTNRLSVILGQEPMLTLGFTYLDGTDRAEVDKKTLMEALSTGEKKALYILNIIFEVEVRKRMKQETLFIIDDIADSFNYKNKYAIIQYLKDISEESNFKQIALTHNFDFFRTIESRFIKYPNCLMATKSTSGVLSLKQATGIRNIFVNDWKKNFFTDTAKRIASIPFIRNIIEYTKGRDDADFVKLTSLLHWRADTLAITEHDLDSIFHRVFHIEGSSPNGLKSVLDIIRQQARACLTAEASANFENKIVLSIAIRIGSEEFMATAIEDAAYLASIKFNQTQVLLSKYKQKFSEDVQIIKILERVVLMTPEQIHLNSFMYEPILDMSDEHLRKLYEDILALQRNPKGIAQT